MKKIIFAIVALISASLLVCPAAFADPTPATASAGVPCRSDVNPVLSKVMGDGLDPAYWSDTTNYYPTINFGALNDLVTYTVGTPGTAGYRKYQVWKQDATAANCFFFVLDCGYDFTDSPCSTNISQITLTYADDDNPNSAVGGHGLGWKATATFVKKGFDGATGAELTDVLLGNGTTGKLLLKSLTGTAGAVLISDLTDANDVPGWLRVYIGLATKDATATPEDPDEAEVFSPGDTGGSYTGTLTITTT